MDEITVFARLRPSDDPLSGDELAVLRAELFPAAAPLAHHRRGHVVELASHRHPQRRPSPHRGHVAVAAAAVVALGVGGIWMTVNRSSEPAPVQQPSPTTATNPVTASAPLLAPQLFPAYPAGDARNVGAEGSYYRQSSDNPGRTTAVVARRDGDELVDGITITGLAQASATGFPGSAATAALVDGVEVAVYVEPGTPAITTVVVPGPLPVMYIGLDPLAFLTSVGNDGAVAKIGTGPGGGQVVLTIGTLPPDYEVVSPPVPFPFGAREANLALVAVGNEDGALAGVAVTDPLASLLPAGKLRAVDVNGIAAWISDGPGHAISWQVASNTWATVAGVDTADEALAIARDLEFIDEATWRDRYDVTPPVLPPTPPNDPEPASPTATTTVITDDPVLFAPPHGLDEYAVGVAGIAPRPPGTISGAAIGPEGQHVGVTVSPDSDDQVPPAWQTRQVGGFDVATGNEDGNQVHAASERCTRIAITGPGDSATDTAAVDALIAGLGIAADGAVTIDLPDGWQPLPVGVETDLYQLDFAASIDGTRHTFVLYQMLDTNVGPFLAPGRGTPTDALLANGDSAFVLAGRDERTYLIFQDGPNAVLLGADDITGDSLVTFQEALIRQPWSATSAQRPDQAGPDPTVSADTPDSACPPPTLTFDSS